MMMMMMKYIISCLVIAVQGKHIQVKLICMILELHGGSFRQLNASKRGQTYPLVPKKGRLGT